MNKIINRRLIYHEIYGYILIVETPENELFISNSYGEVSTLKDLVEKGVEIFGLFQYNEDQTLAERKMTYTTDMSYLRLRLDDIIENSPEELQGEFDLSTSNLESVLLKYKPT